MHSLKMTVKHHLEPNDLNSIAELAGKHSRVSPLLVRLSYDKDTLVGWRAIKAMDIAERELLRSLNDESDGIGWLAMELPDEHYSAARFYRAFDSRKRLNAAISFSNILTDVIPVRARSMTRPVDKR